MVLPRCQSISERPFKKTKDLHNATSNPKEDVGREKHFSSAEDITEFPGKGLHRAYAE
jgi:hypothetical protein